VSSSDHDSHLSGAAGRARDLLRRDFPGLELTVHARMNGAPTRRRWRGVMPISHARYHHRHHAVLDDHVRAVMPALATRRNDCDALICCMSAAEIVKLTRVGKFDMSGEALGAIAWLKKLRGNRKGASPGGKGRDEDAAATAEAAPLHPGTAQDMRAYFLTLQYWLAGSEQNIVSMVRLLVDRYADGPRRSLRGVAKPAAPVEYPISACIIRASRAALRTPSTRYQKSRKTWNGRHSAAAFVSAGRQCRALRRCRCGIRSQGAARDPGLRQRARPASGDRALFVKDGRSMVDAVVSLTGSRCWWSRLQRREGAEDILAARRALYLGPSRRISDSRTMGASDRA